MIRYIFLISLVLNFGQVKILGEQLKASVFLCNFDSGDKCEGVTSVTGLLAIVPSADTNDLTVNSIKITDVTSITQATSEQGLQIYDQPPCVIPWTEGGSTWYFCQNDYCMPFQPTNNAIRECQKGKFLSGQTNANGRPFTGEFKIASIDLGSPGTYEMTFYVMMSCDGFSSNPCQADGADDSITITVDENKPSKTEYTIDYDNIGLLTSWQEKNMTFEAVDSTIELIVRFKRTTSSTFLAYFGFDELNILRSGDSSLTSIQQQSTQSLPPSTTAVSDTTTTTTTTSTTTTISTTTTTTTTTIISSSTSTHEFTSSSDSITSQDTTVSTSNSHLELSSSTPILIVTSSTEPTTTRLTTPSISSTSISTASIETTVSSSLSTSALASVESSSSTSLSVVETTTTPTTVDSQPLSSVSSSLSSSSSSIVTSITNAPSTMITTKPEPTGLSTGAIVGIVVGSVAGVAIIVVVGIFVYKKYNVRKPSPSSNSEFELGSK